MAATPPERVVWAVEQLDVAESERILEVGPGAGHAVRLICARLRSGSITAIDASATQVLRTRALNESCSRATIEQLSLQQAAIAWTSQRFDKILAVNVNAFWTNAQTNLAAAARLLHKSGKLVLVYEPPSNAQLEKLRTILKAALQREGWTLLTERTKTFRSSDGVALIATRT